jgi:hypothetical protein
MQNYCGGRLRCCYSLESSPYCSVLSHFLARGTWQPGFLMTFLINLVLEWWFLLSVRRR